MPKCLHMLVEEVKNYMDRSVLCWLATCSVDLLPNVSPKQLFTYFGHDRFIIANIASPQTVQNIKANPQVCVSFVDILVQKGFQLKGEANILTKQVAKFDDYHAPLYRLAGDRFPIASICCIQVQSVKRILAPSYQFYPETTTEADQVQQALKAYGFDKTTTT